MKAFQRCPATLSIIVLAIGAYGVLGAQSDPRAVISIPDHAIGILRHGNVNHLIANCVLLAIGGWMTEPAIGSMRTILLAVACAALGSMAELLLAGPGFIGISGVAYGLVCFGLIAGAPPGQRGLLAVLIALALIAELTFLRREVAVYAHLTSALTGGGYAMFASLFGSKGPALKRMEWQHVARVVEIIAQTDDDDALEAESTLLNSGYENMFVLADGNQVLGVTGFGLDEQVPDVAWLSWTYLDQSQTGKGLGSKMLNDLLGKLNKQGVRKIFIETSDYQDFGKKIYAAAHKLYEEFGAGVELTLPDYHGPGEAKIIYGLDNPEAAKTPMAELSGATGLLFSELQKAPETQDVAGLMWEEAPSGVAGLDRQLSQARGQKFRMAVLALPSDLSSANADALQVQGLAHNGTLKDYYCTGLHQEWWSCALNPK